jgi:hydroxypyruvate reductase
MAQAVEEVLGDLVVGGVVSVKTGYTAPVERVTLREASHPVPDEAGEAATREMLELLDGAGEETLVIALISGGGSALLPLPAEGVTLDDKQRMTDLMLAAGADINEMNAVRKHISGVKGGRLAERAHPAQLVTLVLSDVVGDPLDVIASGPTVPDRSTYADASAVLDRYDLWERAPWAVAARLRAGLVGAAAETPKEGDPIFDATETLLVGTNASALRACVAAAEEAGYRTMLLSSLIEGETADVGRMHAAIAREIRRSGNPLSPPACVVSGGETTVTIRGDGMGGRNQELALAAAIDLDGESSMVVLSAGTDGTDGPNDAAGAIAYGDTVARGRAAGHEAREFLARNDSYNYFDAIGDLIRTGPTNTNVMDVHLIIVE